MTVNQHDRLRRLLDDKLDADHPESEAFFDNQRIEDLLESHSTIWGAAAEGWNERMADYADAVDVMENGSDRKLSQLYKNAKANAEYYGKMAREQEDEDVRSMRIVGKSFELGATNEDDTLGPEDFPYPVERGPAVL